MIQRRRYRDLYAYFAHTRDARVVYVEGLSDARILNRAFVDCGRSEIVAYSVDSVDFDDVGDVPRSNREKCRLIARLFQDQCVDVASGKALCVIDADFDHYDGTACCDPFLVLTDFADLTLYFAHPAVLSYSATHIFGDEARAVDILNQVHAACMTLFAARRGLREIAPQIGFVDDPGKACVFVGTTVSVDIDRLVAQILSPAGAMRNADALKCYIEQFAFRRDISERCQMQGHDFVAVLRVALAKLGRGRFSNAVPATAVEAMIYGAQAAVDFCSSELLRTVFQKLCGLSEPRT